MVMFLYPDNEAADRQTVRMSMLIWVFIGRTRQKVRFLVALFFFFFFFTFTLFGLI